MIQGIPQFRSPVYPVTSSPRTVPKQEVANSKPENTPEQPEVSQSFQAQAKLVQAMRVFQKIDASGVLQDIQ